MQHRTIKRLCLISAALALPPLTLAQAINARPQSPPSNILLIIADDLGNDKIGVYMEGDDATRPKTPVIDALAADGVRFVNAYSNPVCSPTRATLLTGRYGFRTGIGTLITPRAHIVLPMFPAEFPIPIMLNLGGSGFDHSEIGKWHLASGQVGGPRNPLDHGFNWSAGAPCNLGTGCRNECNYFSWFKQINGEVSRVNVYATTDTTNDAIARANEMAEPWFMWLAYNASHKPFHVPPAYLHNQPDPGRDDVRKFAAATEALDTEIGRLLTSIEPRILENTTIVFLGDNGTPSDATVPPFDPQRAKETVYESGVNVPFIVTGAAVPPSSRGRTTRALVNTTDVYATVADIAGVRLTEVIPDTLELDSISLLPVLADPDRVSGPRRFAYVEMFSPNGPGPYDRTDRAMRDQRWKLIRTFRSGRDPATIDEFFNLDDAPPGLDGDDLCPCPENLDPEELAAYDRLVRELEALSGP